MPVWLRTLLFLGVSAGAVSLAVALIWRAPLETTGDIPALDPEILSVAGAVDVEFAQAWARQGVKPAALADEFVVIRRLSLGLLGTIPSYEEIRLARQVPEANRVDWWVSRALQDSRYGDYVAERLARAYAGTESGPFLVFRRRRFVDWLSEQLQQNLPYDVLARSLIASNGMSTSEPATNFITRTVMPGRGPEEARIAARLSRAFLGIRLDCVECHDDFLDGKWKQRDFHQLAAFFERTELSATGVADTRTKPYEVRFRGQVEAVPVEAAVPFGAEWLPAQGGPRERLAAWVTDPRNRGFSRTAVNRVWALLFGQPLVSPIDRIGLDDPVPPGLDLLARDFATHGHDLRRLIRIVAATEVFRRQSVAPEGAEPAACEAVWASFPMSRLRPEQVARSIYQAASLGTVDAASHILLRLQRLGETNDFVTRYGDMGENEFEPVSATVPQRLLLMNGKLVQERTKENPIINASTRIGMLAASDDAAVEAAYLAILSRTPSTAERAHFVKSLEGSRKSERSRRMEDLYWSLFNSTEFSWNH